MKKKPLEQLTPEQVTLRRMAVTAEVNSAYNTTEMRNGTYGYLITQITTWDGQSRDTGLQNLINTARIQPYYGVSSPPADKMTTPVMRDETQETELRAEEISSDASTPSQQSATEQADHSEPVQTPASDEPAQLSSARDQPGQQQETQQQNTQSEQTATDDDSDRSPQPSTDSSEREGQQQTPAQMQGTNQQQVREEPPHPVNDAIRADNLNVPASPMVNHATMTREILNKQGQLTHQDSVAVTGDNAEPEPLKAISSPNASESTRANIEANQPYIREAMATFRCHHEIDEIDAAGFLIDGTIKEGAITYLNGNSGCGKTFLLAGILYCIATGRDFAGRKTEQRDCYCFEMEDADDLNFRVMALEKHFEQQSDRLHLTDLQIKPSNKRDLALLQKIAVDNCDAGKPPPVIAFDTLSFMIDGSENDSTDVMSFVESLLALHAEFGVTFICISHNGKDKQKGIAGSHKFFAHAKTVYEIEGDNYDGDWVLMVPKKVRFAGKMTIKMPLCPYTIKATDKYPDGIETQFVDYTRAEDIPNYFDADVDDKGNPCAVEVSQLECYVVYSLGLLKLEGHKSVTEDLVRDKLNTLLGDMSDKKNQNKRLRIIKQLRQMAGKGIIHGEKLGDEQTTFSVPDNHPYTLKN